MQRYQCKESRITKSQGNMTTPKEINTAPITDAKEMEIYLLFCKELRIILFKKFSELKEYKDK